MALATPCWRASCGCSCGPFAAPSSSVFSFCAALVCRGSPFWPSGPALSRPISANGPGPSPWASLLFSKGASAASPLLPSSSPCSAAMGKTCSLPALLGFAWSSWGCWRRCADFCAQTSASCQDSRALPKSSTAPCRVTAAASTEAPLGSATAAIPRRKGARRVCPPAISTFATAAFTPVRRKSALPSVSRTSPPPCLATGRKARTSDPVIMGLHSLFSKLMRPPA